MTMMMLLNSLSVQRVHRMRSTEFFTGEGCGSDPQVRLNLHMQRNVNTCTNGQKKK